MTRRAFKGAATHTVACASVGHSGSGIRTFFGECPQGNSARPRDVSKKSGFALTGALGLTDVPGKLVVVALAISGWSWGSHSPKWVLRCPSLKLSRVSCLNTRRADAAGRQASGRIEIGVLTSAKAKALASEGDAGRRRGGRWVGGDAFSLVTVGRKPATEGWDLSAIDLDMDGPFIRIDDKCRTSICGVRAIGDVTGEPMLADCRPKRPGRPHQDSDWARISSSRRVSA
jgi:hypothetical protein